MSVHPRLPASDLEEHVSNRSARTVRALWAIAIILLATCVAGCSTGAAPLTKAQAAAAFTSAYNAFILRGQQIEKLSPPGRPASPAADNDAGDALTAYGNKLKSIVWPVSSSPLAQAAENVLTKEAVQSHQLSSVKSTDPAIVTDYRNFDATARTELATENRLRASLGLPDRK